MFPTNQKQCAPFAKRLSKKLAYAIHHKQRDINDIQYIETTSFRIRNSLSSQYVNDIHYIFLLQYILPSFTFSDALSSILQPCFLLQHDLPFAFSFPLWSIYIYIYIHTHVFMLHWRQRFIDLFLNLAVEEHKARIGR